MRNSVVASIVAIDIIIVISLCSFGACYRILLPSGKIVRIGCFFQQIAVVGAVAQIVIVHGDMMAGRNLVVG